MIGISLGLGTFFNNHLYIVVIVHGIWLPFILFFSDPKEIILYLVNEAMLACLIWDDYLGIVILMPLTILLGTGLVIYKFSKKDHVILISWISFNNN